MIAITFALPSEGSGIMRLVSQKQIAQCSDRKIIYGTIDRREVAIFHTGVGQKSCERNIQNFLRAVQPNILISSGFAGGVSDKLNVGDLILAENLSDAALATLALEGGALRRQSPPVRLGPGSQELAAPDPGTKQIHLVKLFTAKSIIDSSEARNRIARERGAAAVDMETDVIAQACSGLDIPMLSLRVISDTSKKPLPLPPQVLFDMERQRTNYGKLISYLVSHPVALPRLIRFARDIGKARTNLTYAIIGALRVLVAAVSDRRTN